MQKTYTPFLGHKKMFTRKEKYLYLTTLLLLLAVEVFVIEKYTSTISKQTYEETLRTYKTEEISVKSLSKEK